MADKTTGDLQAVPVGDLPLAPDIYDDTLIPVEQNGEARHMTGAQWKDYGVAAAKEEADRAELAVSHYPKIQNGTWWVWDVEAKTYVDTSVQAKGDPFTYEDFTAEQLAALKGDTGNGIKSIERTSGTGAAGTTDTYTITYTDGTKSTYTVYNGKDGETPKKGTDYWTSEDKQEIVDDVTDQVAPPIVQGVGGTVIAVSDSAQRPLKGLRLFGKTTQDGTPSPDVPVELVSVGDKGTIENYVSGKNLLEPKASFAGGYTAIVNADGSVTVTGATTTTNNIYLDIATPSTSSPLKLSQGQDYRMWYEASNGKTIGARATDNDGNAHYFAPGELNDVVKAGYTCITKVYIESVGHEIGDTSLCGTYRIQIEAGNEFTGFEPYKPIQTLTAQTPNGLPGNPLGATIPDVIKNSPELLAGVWYCAEEEQYYISDTVDFARGVYVQRVGTRRFTNADGWSANHGSSNYSDRFQYNLGEVLVPRSGKSNMHSVVDTWGTADNGIGFGSSSNVSDSMVYARFSGITSTDQLNALFATTPFVVSYGKTVPVETPLSAEELTAYAALHTNYPNTTVFNDEGAWMEMDYVADTKIYIDNKFAALSAAFLDN